MTAAGSPNDLDAARGKKSFPPPRRQRAARALAPLLLSAALAAGVSGCVTAVTPTGTPPPINFCQAPGWRQSADIRRVLLVTSAPEINSSAIAEHLAGALRGDLAECGLFELVETELWNRPVCHMNVTETGAFQETVLIDAYHRFNADAVAFLSIDQWHPYWPMRLSATLHLVDVRDAQVLASVQGHWSAADPSTRAHYRAFVTARSQHPYRLEADLQSQPMFAAYVSDQIAGLFCGRAPQAEGSTCDPQSSGRFPRLRRGWENAAAWLRDER